MINKTHLITHLAQMFGVPLRSLLDKSVSSQSRLEKCVVYDAQDDLQDVFQFESCSWIIRDFSTAQKL